MTVITLTDKQYDQVMKDFFAVSDERKKMTKEEVEKLAEKLNTKINIPIFYSEPREHQILVKIVTEIDCFLYEALPNEIYDSIRSLEDGTVDDGEARVIISRLAKLANKKIDIPYLPEIVEYVAISFIVGIVVNAMRKKWNLDKALDEADRIVIPEKESGKDLDIIA